MCILLYEKLIWSSSIPYIYGHLDGVHLHSVYVHSAICETYSVQWYSIDLWSIRGGGPWYLCILLYVKVIWGSGIPFIYGQLEGVNLHSVYGHSAICETDLMQWYSIHLWSMEEGALVYMHSAISESSLEQQYSIHLCSIGGGTSALSTCAFCYMLNLFGVVVFHRYMVKWRRGP